MVGKLLCRHEQSEDKRQNRIERKRFKKDKTEIDLRVEVR